MTTHRRRCSTCGIESEIEPGVSVVPVDLKDARAEVARLAAETEQLRADLDTCANRRDFLVSSRSKALGELAVERARVQAVRDLCKEAARSRWSNVADQRADLADDVLAAIGDGDDRDH